MADLIENEPCYIYHVRDYQEHNQIVEVLSLNYGALTILAQGSKNANAPTKGLFQPFVPLKLSLKKSRSELYFLTGYEHAGNGFDFKMPYYFCASYINELLHHLYHNKESDVALFGSYISTLEAIRDKKNIESHLRNFEMTLLKSLGYSLSNRDDEGALLSFKDKYRFCFGLGFVKYYDLEILRKSHYSVYSSSYNRSYENEDDGMLFSKSKVRGRRLQSNISNNHYAVSHMGYENYQNGFSSEQAEMLQKYSDYLPDFLGPVLTGAQIMDIIEMSFALPDAARNAKLLTSSIINKLLNGREIKSRRLYREYIDLKIKQKSQTKPSNTSADNSQTQLAANASLPENATDNTYDSAIKFDNSINTPEAYLNYVLQNRSKFDHSFIAESMVDDSDKTLTDSQEVRVGNHSQRYVAQFAKKAE